MSRELTLVGFEENDTTNMDSGVSFKSVDLYYSNLKSVSYSNKLNEHSFKNDFKDTWLESDNYKFPKILKFAYITDEMIKVEINREVLQKDFSVYKGKINSKLKIKRDFALILSKLR